MRSSQSQRHSTSPTRCSPWFGDVSRSLAAFLESGGRKIDAWYAVLAVVEVPFDDEADAFRNINTTEELKEADATAER